MQPQSAADAGSAHPRSRHLGLIAFAVVLFLITVTVPLVTSASTYRGGITVNTGGAAIDGNLYVASFRSRLESAVGGDVTLVSLSGSVRGDVGGNVHVLGGRATVHGDVDGSIYVAGGNVEVHGTVGGDLVVSAGRVTLTDGSQVQGDVVVFAGQVESAGTVDGTLYGSAFLVSQEGDVGGNLEIQANRLTIMEGSQIGGDVRYQAPTDGDIADGAQIGGITERTNAAPWRGVGGGALAPFGGTLKLVWLLIAGAALVAIAPRVMNRFAEIASPVVQPAIIGAIALLSLPVFATIAIITVLGVPVGVLLLLAVGVGMYLSQVIVGLTLGRFLLPRRWRDGSRGYLLLAMTVGVILIGVLRMLPVPYLNMVIVALVTILGFGGYVLIVLDLTSDRLRASRRRYPVS